MYPIEVDFEVYKQLTVRRTTEEISYNDVIRELLGLKRPARPNSPSQSGDGAQDDWVTKGVRFPVGTEFRAIYKGQTHTGRVEAGALALNGTRYDSPSAAAVAITNNAVNGWRFWECRLPGKSGWQVIESLRR